MERSHNVREVARNYCVNRSTVYRLKKCLDETGSIETRTYLRGRKPALTPEEVKNINQLVKNRPDLTMQEIIEALHLTVSNETVRKTVRQLGYRRKKKSLHASEQERLRCGAEEKNWNGLISGFKASDLVFLDESGCNTDMTRRYAYSLGGSRAVDSAPLSKPKNTTILSSIQLDGTLRYTTFSGGTTVERFKR